MTVELDVVLTAFGVRLALLDRVGSKVLGWYRARCQDDLEPGGVVIEW